MSISLRGRDAVALAMAVAAHAAILAAPTPERPLEGFAEPSALVDGIDFELEPPAPRAATAAPAGGEPVAGEPEAAGEIGKAPPAEKAQAPAPGAAAAKVASVERARPAPAARAAEPKAAPPETAPPAAEGAARPAAEAAAPTAEAHGAPAPTAEAPAPAAEAPGTPATAPPGDEYGGAPPAAGGGIALAPGLGTPLWTVPGVLPGPDAPRAAPTAAPRARPVDPAIAGTVLNETLHGKDKSVGISVPAAGAVASTLADMVRSSTAPLDARATFEVKLGADGQVLGVRLVSASAGDGPTWDRIVDGAKGALAGSALQMGPDRQPVTVTVKVQSKVQYPSGSRKKPKPELVCAEEVLEQLQQAMEDPSRLGQLRGPGDGAPPGGDMAEEERKRMFCIPVGLRAKGDLSDIGAHKVNVVSASFAVKREGERALPHEDILPIDTRVPWAPKDPNKTKLPPPKKKKWKKKKEP
ncbi:hypothetical protein WMF27_00580 [Sorangium sp. So ce281]|uniref:hypothetical protein n=1 Tax=Sorangium sp. So ce281 TaxID=3133293 RepID=UPI003F623F43